MQQVCIDALMAAWAPPIVVRLVAPHGGVIRGHDRTTRVVRRSMNGVGTRVPLLMSFAYAIAGGERCLGRTARAVHEDRIEVVVRNLGTTTVVVQRRSSVGS